MGVSKWTWLLWVLLGVGAARGGATIFDMDEPPTIQPPPEAAPEPAPTPRPVVRMNVPATSPGPATRAAAATKPATPTVVVRVKLPDAAALQEAERMVAEVYGEQFRQLTTPRDKESLARRLRRDGTAEPLAAARYALLKKARDLSAEAGNAELAGVLIADLEKAFDIQGWKLATEVVGVMGRSATSRLQKQVLADMSATYAIQAMEAEDFEAAKLLADSGVAAARTVGGSSALKLIKSTAELARGVREAEEMKKALTAAADAAKYQCIYHGDWKSALAKLAAGSDKQWAAAAKTELAGTPADTTAQIALGDAWWDVAQQAEGFAKRRIQEHAGTFYKASLPGISGLAKGKVLKRLELTGMEVLEVPDFVIAYLDSIADKLPQGDAPRDEFRKALAAAGRGGYKALQVNGQPRPVKFLGRIQYIVSYGGPTPRGNERTIYRSVGVRFEYHGILMEFAWRDTHKTSDAGWRAIYDDWSRQAKAGQVFELEGDVNGFQMFTTLPAPDGRQRVTIAPIKTQMAPAVLTIREREQ